MSVPLTALDATFLELEEADDSAHMHIGGLMIFEPRSAGNPTLRSLRRHLEQRLGALPLYGCRLSQPRTGGLRWPEWQPDERFSIENHVHRAALPAPGGEAELLEWLGDFWSHRLDRSRPLWEIVLLEGLGGGRWALATKTHHAMIDGVGSVDVGHLLLDAARRPRRGAPVAEGPGPRSEPERHGLLRAVPEALAGGVRAVAGAAVHPSRVREALSRSSAMLDVILRDEVVPAPGSSLNVPIGASRRYAVVRADLAELKAIKRRLGGTVNDVVLAAAAGGLRRLLLERGEEPPRGGLRAMVPVNLRTASEHLGLGNKVTSLFVHLPVAEPDALRRYRLTMAEAEELKHGTQAKGSSTLVGLTATAPPVLHSFLARSLFASRLFNVTITNVPGPRRSLYAFGSRLEEIYPLVPLAAEHAVGIAVLSYDGVVCFGLNGDDRAAADLETLRAGIAAELAELGRLEPRTGAAELSGAVPHP